MSNKKHIDRLFQEKLKDFEVFPDAEVWKNIEEQLVKKKKRRVFPLWLRFGSAAAILLFLVTSGIWFYNTKNDTPKLPDTNSIITDIDTEENNNDLEKTIEPSVKKDDFEVVEDDNSNPSSTKKVKFKFKNVTTPQFAGSNTKETISASPGSENQVEHLERIDATITQLEKPESFDKQLETIESNDKVETAIAANTQTKEDSKTPKKKDINEVLKDDKERIALDENETNKNKWSVGSTVAPIYFNTLSKGSPIHSMLAENEKKSITSISYGVKVNYKINDKLSLQSGINALDLAYQTKNVSALITSANGLSNDTNINTNVDGIKIVATPSIDNSADRVQEFASSTQQGSLANLNGDLNQSFSYIEVPMEAKYALLQKKLGVNVIGGLSTYVLYNKGVTIQDENGSTILGEASNINDVNFSGNIGLDVDYNISKKLYINVSPMFKYQFNTFSKNDGGFQPYYLGIYTGLNFRF